MPWSEIISIRIPRYLLYKIDRLVEMNYFTSRSEVIREALRKLIQELEEREEFRDFLRKQNVQSLE